MARSWAFEPKTRSAAVAVHLISPVARSRPSYTFSAEDPVHSVPMSSRFTKKSLVSISGRSVKTPRGSPVVGVQGPHPAEKDRHLRSGQVEHERPVHQQGLRRELLP